VVIALVGGLLPEQQVGTIMAHRPADSLAHLRITAVQISRNSQHAETLGGKRFAIQIGQRAPRIRIARE
jgi:hypothetical protein